MACSPDRINTASLYVVHALPQDESAEFERHLAGCEPCRAEASRLEEIAVVLARAVAAAGKTPVVV